MSIVLVIFEFEKCGFALNDLTSQKETAEDVGGLTYVITIPFFDVGMRSHSMLVSDPKYSSSSSAQHTAVSPHFLSYIRSENVALHTHASNPKVGNLGESCVALDDERALLFEILVRNVINLASQGL